MGTIDLKAYLAKLKKNWLIIALCCVIGLSAAYIYSSSFVEPMYSSSVKMSVKETDWSDGGVSVTGIQVSSQMIDNCFVVLEDKVTFEKVATVVNEELGTKYSPGQIRGWVSYSRVGETIYFRVTATTPDAELSAVVCNAVIAVAPELIVKYVANIPVVPLDDATPNYAPVSPNTRRNMILGFMLALVACCGVLFLDVYFDNTVNDEEKLKERFDLSVIGVVPHYEPHGQHFGYVK
ncbi:MAG: hypothetical protein IJN17_09105 [Clostridia bacterium]|nr:hypothetical protein [Clostridia bacterium]